MRSVSAVLGCLFVLVAAASLQAQEKPKEVAPQETIQFEQDKAQAHMRELEQRMFRLAELIREAQPEDAARLKLGVERARDTLIADRMSQTSKLLATLKLEQAASGQKEIIAELEELKRLLLSTDIDLQLKLEQLKKLKDARARIEALARKEKVQLNDTKAATEAYRKEDFVALKDNEERNKRLGEDIEQMLKQFGASAASATGAVNGAVKNIGNAAGKLGENNGMEANKEQQEAIDKLVKADANLAELQSALEKELEAFVRQRVMETLAQMIVEQVQVRQTTEKLVPRVAEGRKETVVAVKRLSESEEKIVQLGEEALGLCELVEFSMAFPPALRSVIDQMEFVAAELSSGRANAEVVGREKQIEDDLQELLNALKQASRPGGSASGGGGGGLNDNLNKLLAEVKMLRWMEIALNKETKKLQQEFAGKSPKDPDVVARLKALSEQQQKIQSVTQRLHDATCQDCLAK
jgi:citrate lyase gamma subunit